MMYNLVKKDFLLVKKYLIYMLIGASGIPVFINIRIGNFGGGFLSFFITVIFIEYGLFNTVSMLDYKYKGSALLCTAPYTRNALVKARYLFMLVVFMFCYVIYTITALLVPLNMTMLNISTVGISLLIISIFFGITIPVQYKIGYERTKYISSFFVFICPFVIPAVIKIMQSGNFNLRVALLFPETVQSLIPGVLALIIGFASMAVSMRIYSRANL